ncbi:MAG TPA: acyloxyacyl hydrolase [Alphaproteobacteria bacterium]|nr:acyloxyacyl hydrolase [Alphaproteobacteria bacterium]
MSRKLGLLVLLLALVSISPAHAADTSSTFKQPDLVSFGVSYFDFDKDEPHKQSVDFRGEYRWGLSMLPLISPWFKSWDQYVQFHPYAGLEVTSLGMLYGNGGWAMDAYLGRHFVFTWSEGVGLYEGGDMTILGSVIEFRSMAELGYRFDNEMRLTGQISHISNAGLTSRNPGAEIAGLYLHMPISMICGGKQ